MSKPEETSRQPRSVFFPTGDHHDFGLRRDSLRMTESNHDDDPYELKTDKAKYQVYYVVIAQGLAAIRRRESDATREGPSSSCIFESAYKHEGHVLPLQDALNYLGSRGERVVSVINGPPLTYTMNFKEEMQLIVVTLKN